MVNPLLGRRPTPPSPSSQMVTRLAHRSHQCAVQAIAASNNCLRRGGGVRCIWLDRSNLSEGLRKELLEAPISPDGLFDCRRRSTKCKRPQMRLTGLGNTCPEFPVHRITGGTTRLLRISERGVLRQL
ncbi:unnamed protein product [Pleuronectes platessa]|uniref:Uncharacterized protein n=1 Tax=Pleuronectes platessa TaxID=8262 RepID=A0A9N7UKQ3_PLEPL|nr:unnamed protein product [Pleuronectes platessa]